MLLPSLLNLPSPEHTGLTALRHPAVRDLGSGSFTRALMQHMQGNPGGRFSIAAIELAGKPADAVDSALMPLPAPVRATFLERLRTGWHADWVEGVIDDHLGLLLPAENHDMALKQLQAVLEECGRYSVLSERQCHVVHWRVGLASYPDHGHAPWRLLRRAGEQVPQSAWHGKPPVTNTFNQPARSPSLARYR